MSNNMTGLVSAPFTPMNPDGSVNLDKIPDVVAQLLENNVKGIFVCGSTGEGPSMTGLERRAVAEAFVKAVNKRMKVFVHVGHNSIAEAAELAQHAQAIGADYISATPPTYFKIKSVKVLADCLAQIAAGAPDLPLYYYNIPALTGSHLDMEQLLQIAADTLPTLAGIKFTAPQIHDYQSCLNFAGKKYDILYGTDEMLLSALATGATGFIGSTYNFAAPLYTALIDAYNKGDFEKAQRCQLLSVKMVRIIVQYGGLRAQKAMLKLAGMDCGPVRLPLEPLTSNEYQAMEKDLEQIGFFDWCNKPAVAKAVGNL